MTVDDLILLDIAREVAVSAGELALQRRREGVKVAATKSSPVDVVTETDREVEAFVRARLSQLRPNDGFLGEESDGTRGSSGLTWVVDPIDGTVNFLYDIPAWAVSIAVVEGPATPKSWTTIAGCVVNPVLGEVYTASRGRGAHLGETRISTSGAATLGSALVGTGFSYDADDRVRQAKVVANLIDRVRDIRRIGSAALDLCDVACGRLDAFYETGLHPWDHAAGSLIATEAGAQVGGLAGGAGDADFMFAATPGVAEPFRELLNEADAAGLGRRI